MTEAEFQPALRAGTNPSTTGGSPNRAATSDILLTHGYFMREDEAELKVNKPYPPLGLLYLTAFLRERGKRVDVFDSTFRSFPEFVRHVADTKPHVVGFYVNMLTRRNVLRMIPVARDAGALIVVGGPEPVNYPDEYLGAGAALIVKGEGEQTLDAVLEVIARTRGTQADRSFSDCNFGAIDGLIYAGPSGHIETPDRDKVADLDSLPFPARDAIDLRVYMDHWKAHHGASSVSLITARGCPYTCRWCSHSVYGYSYRTRSPEDVAEEVLFIRDTYDPEQLWYADDVFSINPKWLKRYARALEERGLHLPFETITREDRLDEGTIETLAAMGCYRLWVGAESGSQKILDAMDRRTDAGRMRRMIALLQAKGIRVGTFIMFGYAGETWEDLNATHQHLAESAPDDLLTTVTYPIKGTPYFDEVRSDIIARSSWQDGSDADHATRFQKSTLFYFFTKLWMISGVRRSQTRRLRRPVGHLKSLLLAAIARTGMYVTWRLPGPS